MRTQTILTGVLLLATASPLLAQQLGQPTPQPLNPPTVPAPGVGPALKQATVASDPSQRPNAPAQVPSTGPAQQVPALPTQDRMSAPSVPLKVTDGQGRVINGAVQAGPNRIYDPGTGKYHNTVGAGEQQRIVP